MVYLGEVFNFKLLPNLLTLKLELSNNNLGGNVESLSYLWNSLNNLPKNLQSFMLELYDNILGENN